MEKFITCTGIVAPLDRAHVDTDVIIPKQFLRSIQRTGFGAHLFDEWRFLDRTEPGAPPRERLLNPDFVLNWPRYKDASILLCRQNFGCGSSREHAAWALLQYGFKVVIAPSFAEIFLANCYKNGLLPVVLPPAAIDTLFAATFETAGYVLTVDLARQCVVTPDAIRYRFEIAEGHKFSLLNGLDEIGLTLRHEAEVAAFEACAHANTPWLRHDLAGAPRFVEGGEAHSAPAA